MSSTQRDDVLPTLRQMAASPGSTRDALVLLEVMEHICFREAFPFAAIQYGNNASERCDIESVVV